MDRRRDKKKINLSFNWILVYMFMIALVAFTALPLLYVVSTAFKPLDELFLYPPRFLVKNPTITNFTDLVLAMTGSVIPFSKYLFNSVFTAVVTVVVTVIVSSMGAFALEKYKLPGGNAIFMIIIAALMFSPHVTQIPTYMVVNSLGMINTYWALIIPKIAVAYNFFLMKQFIVQFPDELLEAAKIDGSNDWHTFWKIVMPNLKPAWSTLIVFSFVANWNDYFTPLIYTTNQTMKTLPLALQTIAGGAGAAGSINVSRAGAMAAATFLMITPTIVIFLVMQKRVMETMTYSGIKA